MGANEKLTAIADAIREKTGKTDKLSLDGMADGVGEIFDAGKKAGMKAFWDAYITDTMLADASKMFYGDGWGQSNFFPTRDIRPTGSPTSMFENFGHIVNGVKDEPLDLVARLEECNVTLDFSNATGGNSFFRNANISTLPVLDFSNMKSFMYAFGECSSLTTIEKIIFGNATSFSNTFREASSLQEVRFEGSIGVAINIQWSPLSHESLMSLINCLAVVSGKTLTIGSDNLAKLTADEIQIITDKGWNIA